jgi:hypothetical protein
VPLVTDLRKIPSLDTRLTHATKIPKAITKASVF